MIPIVYTKVRLRNPFDCKSLPALAAIHKIGFQKYHSTIRKGLVGYPFRILYTLLHSAGVKGYGSLTYRNKNRQMDLSFNARNTQFQSVYFSQYKQGYEAETLALIDALIGKDTFYDIGSNWGHYALHIAGNKNFVGEIHAFEPLPSTFEDLRYMVSQAGLGEYITCHNLALADVNDEGIINIPGGIHSGRATVNHSGKGIKITQRRLDDLPITLPTFMKVDAEGSEDKIFIGAGKMISRQKPLIIMENHKHLNDPETTIRPLTILEKAGYKFFLPVFIMQWNDQPYFAGYNEYSSLELGEEMTLGLVEFTAQQRYLFNPQINILACHASRTERIKSIFSQSLAN